MNWNALILIPIILLIFALFFFFAKRRQGMIEARRKLKGKDESSCNACGGLINEKDLPG